MKYSIVRSIGALCLLAGIAGCIVVIVFIIGAMTQLL